MPNSTLRTIGQMRRGAGRAARAEGRADDDRGCGRVVPC